MNSVAAPAGISERATWLRYSSLCGLKPLRAAVMCRNSSRTEISAGSWLERKVTPFLWMLR